MTLFVASTGGHLSELIQLASRIEVVPAKRVWVTFDTPQSRSMLEGENVEFVSFMAPREWGALARNFGPALRILRRHRPTRVFSTGSGIALSFLPLARVLGAKPTYIESAARTEGPSATGKILAKFPGIKTYCQYTHWARGAWEFGYSVFDDFPEKDGEPSDGVERPRVFVQVGTLDYPFGRLVERVASQLPPDAEVTWQLGATPAPAGLPGRHFDFAPAAELADAIERATVVISHAGCGSALMSLNHGVRPVLVPRWSANGEHVDDHQVELASELAERGVATYSEVEDMDTRILRADHRFTRRQDRHGDVT
ncbi:glycosyltransferase [Microbacterium sp. G2-8]|uniref:glycosyltransferase n=1 Tax=Microbacterium sp. G2-8 TaxID=2842454 RepID=UPI001C8AFD4C|nr:glycosyltransferase [Microbacterium sp. G2-8]